MTDQEIAMERLRSLLAGIQPGAIPETSGLDSALAECWDEFRGDTGGMAAYKLHGRMEEAKWEPPLLTFQIERHGGTALGSSRAEIQAWTLNVELGTRECRQSGFRQSRPMRSRLNVEPLAEEIADLIRGGREDQRLKWSEGGHVRVLIGKLLPEDGVPRQTREGRRRGFWGALDDLLRPDWERRQQSYFPRVR